LTRTPSGRCIINGIEEPRIDFNPSLRQVSETLEERKARLADFAKKKGQKSIRMATKPQVWVLKTRKNNDTDEQFYLEPELAHD